MYLECGFTDLRRGSDGKARIIHNREKTQQTNGEASASFLQTLLGVIRNVSMMVPDLKKCIWHVDLQICAEGLTA